MHHYSQGLAEHMVVPLCPGTPHISADQEEGRLSYNPEGLLPQSVPFSPDQVPQLPITTAASGDQVFKGIDATSKA